MDREFVPKKTITIQMSPELHRMMTELLEAWKLSKTKLLDKLITEAYNNLYSEE